MLVCVVSILVVEGMIVLLRFLIVKIIKCEIWLIVKDIECFSV